MICTALRAAMIYQACGLDKKRTKLSLRSFLAPPVGLDLHLLPHWVGENKGVAAVFSVGNNSPSYCCGARQKLRLTVQARFSPTATHTAPLLLPPLAAQRLVAAATRSPPCFRPRRRSGRSPNAGIVISVRSRPPLTRVSEAQSAVVNDSPVDCQSRRPGSPQRAVSRTG